MRLSWLSISTRVSPPHGKSRQDPEVWLSSKKMPNFNVMWQTLIVLVLWVWPRAVLSEWTAWLSLICTVIRSGNDKLNIKFGLPLRVKPGFWCANQVSDGITDAMGCILGPQFSYSKWPPQCEDFINWFYGIKHRFLWVTSIGSPGLTKTVSIILGFDVTKLFGVFLEINKQ